MNRKVRHFGNEKDTVASFLQTVAKKQRINLDSGFKIKMLTPSGWKSISPNDDTPLKIACARDAEFIVDCKLPGGMMTGATYNNAIGGQPLAFA